LFKLVQAGPESRDCTAPYDVILDRSYTVKEFIHTVLTQRSDEWGYIGIKNPDEPFFGDPKIRYRWGIEEYAPLRSLFDKRIISVTASGGWSRMDYQLVLE